MLFLRQYLSSLLLLLCLLGFTVELAAQSLTSAEKEKLAGQIEQSLLKGLLDQYYPRAIDREKGGFITTFTYNWQPTGAQDKMIVTQARHTWLPSKAAQLYPNQPALKEAARQGYHFLRDAMWDKQYGGFYTWVSRDGQPKLVEEGKTAYGNAFGIYALSAYYQLTGDTAALHLAQQAFNWLEKHSHDSVKKGYFQHLQRDGTPIVRPKGAEPKQADLGYKDQNSSIHLLEALTELYTVWPDPLVQERLAEMLTLIRDTIVTPQGYLTLFLTPDWQPVSYRDSSEAARKAHYNLDHVSYGHDVETAYLLLEATHVLGNEHDPVTEKISKKMVDHSLRYGWDEQVGGFYEKGYYFKGQSAPTLIDDRKNWWAQAEGMNTLLLMAEKYPNDPMHYGEKFKKQWNFIQQYLLDAENGGWYEGTLDKEPERKTGNKAHAWKAAYHEGRSLMNCIERLRPDQQAPAAVSGLTLKAQSNGALLLTWQPSRDDHHLQGYDIYLGNQRIGFTPLTKFVLKTVPKTASSVLSVKARDVQGNASAPAQVKLTSRVGALH